MSRETDAATATSAGRAPPVVAAPVTPQVLSSGLNLLGGNQHLSTAGWGLFLIGVTLRVLWARRRPFRTRKH